MPSYVNLSAARYPTQKERQWPHDLDCNRRKLDRNYTGYVLLPLMKRKSTWYMVSGEHTLVNPYTFLLTHTFSYVPDSLHCITVHYFPGDLISSCFLYTLLRACSFSILVLGGFGYSSWWSSLLLLSLHVWLFVHRKCSVTFRLDKWID